MKLLAAILAAAALALAQTPAPATPPAAFDAASIRPTAVPGGRAGIGRTHGFQFDPGRMTAENVSLLQLIEQAWGLKYYQVQAPAWVSNERFDLNTETEMPLTQAQMVRLLQPFLTQQFQIKTHHQSKIEPVYAMVVAAGGLKLKPVGSQGVLVRGRRGSAAAMLPLPPNLVVDIGGNVHVAHLVGNVDLDDLAWSLSHLTDRLVVNQIKLDGNFEFRLDCDPASLAGRGYDFARQAATPSPAPSLRVALQQQLGLQLEPRHLPIAILVVDSASKTPLGN